MNNFDVKSVGNKYLESIDQAPSQINKVYADGYDKPEDVFDEENDDNVIVIHEHHHHHHHKNVTKDSMEQEENENKNEFLPIPSRLQQEPNEFNNSEPNHFNNNPLNEKIELNEKVALNHDVFDQGVFEYFLKEFFEKDPENNKIETVENEQSNTDQVSKLYQNLYSHFYGEYLRRNGYEDYKEVAREDIEEFVEDGFTPILEIELD